MKGNKFYINCPYDEKDLAKTLQRISRLGYKEFYNGKTAEMIVNSMNRTGGLISMDDL